MNSDKSVLSCAQTTLASNRHICTTCVLLDDVGSTLLIVYTLLVYKWTWIAPSVPVTSFQKCVLLNIVNCSIGSSVFSSRKQRNIRGSFASKLLTNIIYLTNVILFDKKCGVCSVLCKNYLCTEEVPFSLLQQLLFVQNMFRTQHEFCIVY